VLTVSGALAWRTSDAVGNPQGCKLLHEKSLSRSTTVWHRKSSNGVHSHKEELQMRNLRLFALFAVPLLYASSPRMETEFRTLAPALRGKVTNCSFC
jgi:hypothetical protein